MVARESQPLHHHQHAAADASLPPRSKRHSWSTPIIEPVHSPLPRPFRQSTLVEPTSCSIPPQILKPVPVYPHLQHQHQHQLHHESVGNHHLNHSSNSNSSNNSNNNNNNHNSNNKLRRHSQRFSSSATSYSSYSSALTLLSSTTMANNSNNSNTSSTSYNRHQHHRSISSLSGSPIQFDQGHSLVSSTRSSVDHSGLSNSASSSSLEALALVQQHYAYHASVPSPTPSASSSVSSTGMGQCSPTLGHPSSTAFSLSSSYSRHRHSTNTSHHNSTSSNNNNIDPIQSAGSGMFSITSSASSSQCGSRSCSVSPTPAGARRASSRTSGARLSMSSSISTTTVSASHRRLPPHHPQQHRQNQHQHQHQHQQQPHYAQNGKQHCSPPLDPLTLTSSEASPQAIAQSSTRYIRFLLLPLLPLLLLAVGGQVSPKFESPVQNAQLLQQKAFMDKLQSPEFTSHVRARLATPPPSSASPSSLAVIQPSGQGQAGVTEFSADKIISDAVDPASWHQDASAALSFPSININLIDQSMPEGAVEDHDHDSEVQQTLASENNVDAPTVHDYTPKPTTHHEPEQQGPLPQPQQPQQQQKYQQQDPSQQQQQPFNRSKFNFKTVRLKATAMASSSSSSLFSTLYSFPMLSSYKSFLSWRELSAKMATGTKSVQIFGHQCYKSLLALEAAGTAACAGTTACSWLFIDSLRSTAPDGSEPGCSKVEKLALERSSQEASSTTTTVQEPSTGLGRSLFQTALALGVLLLCMAFHETFFARVETPSYARL